MNAADLVSRTVMESKWRCVHESPEVTVVEVVEGVRNGRSQFVEIAFIPGGLVRHGAGMIPEMLQIRSRMYQRTGSFYDHDSSEPLNVMAILSEDFAPFGIIRRHPYYFIACNAIVAGLSSALLRDLVLATAEVGDQYERNLTGVEDDLF